MLLKKPNNLNRAFKPPTKDSNSTSSNTPIPQPQNVIEKQPDTTKTNEKKYFRVYFSKDVKKKHKVFDDGIFVIASNLCQIYNSEGAKIYETTKPKNIQNLIESEEPIMLGHAYYIEINQILPKEEFESGKAFIQNCLTTKVPDLKPKKKSLHTKLQIVNEIPEDSYILCNPQENLNPFSCYIEPFLTKLMRHHQQEGVKFMLECVCGFKGTSINGCILADSMGLGKTLQSIALIWTLLRQSPFSNKNPFLKKVIIITPVSLVKNWEKEITKWLGNNRLIPLVAIGTREDVTKTINKFCEAHYRCLIISYESFRINVDKFANHCDMLVLDEGHRLKNMNIKTFQSFNKVNCFRRIILTGTPLQNSLDEFYSCVSFVNPGLFSSLTTFRKVFSGPILESFKKNASEDVLNLAKERSKELSKIISHIVLRRQPNILKKMLPPKHEFLVFVRMTDIQFNIYQNTIKEKTFQQNLLENKSGDVLPYIIALRKILNHPHILLKDNSELATQLQKYLFQKTSEFGWDASYKFKFLKDILTHIKDLEDFNEKIIIVSYFTQTLDMIEDLCREMGFKLVRLDGKVAAAKRQGLVDKFNCSFSGVQIFLLCAKAGGTGLNLIGANRMILFEVDWNPSNDLQVMGRIWRDGQKRTVYIYRLISSGTLEEKILQRQIMKGNISDNVVDEKLSEFQVDQENLKKIFAFKSDLECETFAYEENELFELSNLSDDFNESMANYITFIKERKDEKISEVFSQDEKLGNLFDEENIFVPEKNEEKKEDPSEENFLEIQAKNEESLENKETSKSEEISTEKENSIIKESLLFEKDETLKSFEISDNDKLIDKENSIEIFEINSKKRKLAPNENILKIFSKITNLNNLNKKI